MGEPITPEPPPEPPPTNGGVAAEPLVTPFALTSLTEVTGADLVGHTIRIEVVQYVER